MREAMRKLTFVFASGVFGGFLGGVADWAVSAAGLTTRLGVSMAPHMSPEWIYPRLVWGGIWGLLFLLPYMRTSYFLRGLAYSAAPTVAQLAVVYPFVKHEGFFGLDHGALTPVFVLVINIAWGLGTAAWLAAVEKRSA